MKLADIFRTGRSPSLQNVLNRHNQAVNKLNRVLTAYDKGKPFSFADLSTLEEGVEYELQQPDGSEDLKTKVVTRTKTSMLIKCSYPPGGLLGNHFHPDMFEVLEVFRGQLKVILNPGDEERSFWMQEGDKYNISQYVPHSVQAGKEGVDFSVLFLRTDN